AGFPLAERRDGLHSVHPGHPEVHEHHVDARADGPLHCLPSVGRLADDLDVPLLRECAAQPVADDWVVVSKQDLDHFASTVMDGTLAQIAVPSPGVLSMSRLPPTLRTRCRMLLSPKPRPVLPCMPFPSSRMSSSTMSPR